MKKFNNWIICAPGRTGGQLIADILKNFYQLSLKKPARILTTNQDDLFCPNSGYQIYFSHDCEVINKWGDIANKVFSIRNLVESALSFAIVSQSKIYHLYQETEYNLRPIPRKFILSKKEFLIHYSNQVDWYTRAKSLIDSRTYIIDYETIKSNPINVLKILGISKIYYLTNSNKILYNSPFKNPWRPEDWIENWPEIYNLATSLEQDPFSFFK